MTDADFDVAYPNDSDSARAAPMPPPRLGLRPTVNLGGAPLSPDMRGRDRPLGAQGQPMARAGFDLGRAEPPLRSPQMQRADHPAQGLAADGSGPASEPRSGPPPAVTAAMPLPEKREEAPPEHWQMARPGFTPAADDSPRPEEPAPAPQADLWSVSPQARRGETHGKAEPSITRSQMPMVEQGALPFAGAQPTGNNVQQSAGISQDPAGIDRSVPLAEVDTGYQPATPAMRPAAPLPGHPDSRRLAQAQAAPGGMRRGVNLVAAITSLGLIVGGVYWAYSLAVREVRGVPVIQALEGPMRMAPSDPGGEVVAYQGLEVNDVAALGIATPLPDRLVLAPRPVELRDEDLPGSPALADAPRLTESPALAAAGDGLAEPPTDPLTEAPVLAADPQLESASPTELAIDAALDEALGGATEVAATDPDPVAPDVDLAIEPGQEGEITISPRPKARPSRGAPAETSAEASAQTPTAVSAEPAATPAPAEPAEIDPATIPAGTRLVQFGAFDTADEARAEWARLQQTFGEVMVGKALVLQPAESSGRSFFRLRAHGFADDADARRFCAAFAAEGATCIPVPQR